ncbi:unnamed protein product [Prunus armeniaca]|uniref:FYVE-type domain-containing protein n=1 Tax=Prunus armeniaca TaxID=36596 RepID=A0A6J5UIX0_PRUAR|nr:unnamed protein product [Prunus armeniaca]CAB4306280.1 unnamed protein product [Prunus armeniaca]
MLEKIGLPAKPSLRGNTWVVDASHCQGCTSQFTFINRKHHCRRCGGLFCNSCTQQRMFLRGQGDSPVRICEPCKKLEEAARFERHGHKTRAGRGSLKLTSKPEDEVLNQILGNDRKESGQESNSNVVASMQRASSSASCSNSQEDSSHNGVGEIHRSLSVDEPNHLQSGDGSASPEELRQQALDEKKKYKILKGEGKSAEALRAFKRGKELERQADALEIHLRKERKKVLLSGYVAESQTKDGPSESGRRNKVTPPVGKSKDDLSDELKELGWSDMDLRDEEKKQASLSLEGELSSLLGGISQKTNKNKGNSAIDKTQVVAHKKKALMLKREGKLAEAKEELKRAKVLEKELEEQEFLAEAEDSDDELSALIRSMDDDKQQEFSIQYEQENDLNFDHLISAADDHILDSNFEVTDEDMEDPEITAALQSLGWSQDSKNPETPATHIAAVDREALLSQIQSLKREALNQKRAGNVTEAMAQLKQAKLLERDLESLDSPEGNVANDRTTIHNQTADKSSKSFMVGDGNVNTIDMNSKPARKSKLMIQKELLGLKKKALALRREGRLDEAEEELKKGSILERQLEDIENGSMLKAMPGTVGIKVPDLSHEHPNLPVADEEGDNVTDQDMYDPTYLSILKNLGWDEDDNEVANSSSRPSKQIDNLSTKVGESSVTQAPANVLAGGSRRSKAEIQRELLGVKRKALSLRRQGGTEEAEELLKKAKALEDQMVEMEAPKKEVQSDFGRHKENITETTLNSAEDEGDGGNGTEINMQNPAFLSEGTSSSKVAVSAPRSKGEIQRELLDLKRKALAFRRKGETEEAEEVLRMAKVLEIQIEELDAPKDVRLHDDPKEENLESFGLLINTEKEGNLKNDMEVRRSTQTAVGPIDEVVKLSVGSGSVRSHAANPPIRNPNVSVLPTSQFAKENQRLPVELGASGKTRSPDNQRIAGGFSQMPPPVQSGNFVDLLTGDDWRSSQRPVEKQDDSLKFDSVGSFAASPPIQLGSLTFSNEDPASQDNAKIHKVEDTVLVNKKRDADEANSVQEPASQSNQTALRQEILAFKRKALALKREGKLTEAREELRQAKLLEKHLEDDSPQSKTTSSDVVLGSSDSPQSKTTTSAGQKDHGSPSLDPKPLSSRDRFKLQQESLGHKRQAMKLRREGRMEEAEAEFELAKALENQLELPYQDSTTVDKVEPLDDVSVEGLLDPQLLSALKAIGIDDASILSQGPGRPEPSKVDAGKSNNPTQDRSQLEEQIKAEKVKAVNLKRAGKQAEALDALRKAKLLEKKLNSSPSK